MDGNVGNGGGGSTNGDQISRLLQSFMATPNAQMLELMSQNQYPPMLLQSLLLSQALSQNLPNQAPSFPASSSVSSSLQAASSQPSHAPPYTDTSLPTQTPTDPVLQSQASSLLSQVPNPPSSQSVQRPIAPPLLPPNQHQPPSVSSSSQLTQSSSPLTLPPNQHQPLSTSLSAQHPSHWPMHFQGNSPTPLSRLGQDLAPSHSMPILGSNVEARPILSSNVEARPISGSNVQAWPLRVSAIDTGGSGTLPGNSPLPPPPPACRPYTSMQLPNVTDGYGQVTGSQGHARVTTAPGFSGLTTIQRTNNSRLDHASQSLPRDPKKVKQRGKAVRPPGLGRRDRGPSIEDCTSIAMGGVEVVSIDISVYPPMPPTADINFYRLPKQPIFYEINKDSYRMVLDALGLFHQYPNLPTSTTVFDLFSDIAAKLRQRYNLPSISSPLPLAPQELLPLHLMGFSNHGRANGSYNTSKLRPMPYERDTTIRNLLNGNSVYVVPKLVITRDNHFHLHALIRNYPLEANVSLAQVYLGSDDTIRPHRCLSKRIYNMFRNDSDANLNTHALEEGAMEESCDDDDDNEEEEDAAIVAQSLTRAVSLEPDNDQLRSLSIEPTNVLPRSGESSTATSVLPSGTTDQLLDRKLWEKPWTQPTPLDFIPVFFDDERATAIFDIVSEVQREGSVCPGFQVKGTNDQELAIEFIALMKASIRSGDWSKILSPNRHFMRVNDQDDYISSGPGLEQSTVTEIFRQFFEEREDEFCTLLYENYTTLHSADLHISSSKQEDLVLFGAVSALALVYGHYPGRLNPLLLIYLLNDCDLSCLHRDLVSSYLPSVSEMLDRWLNIGPTDQVGEFASHFASYHNIQVGVLNGRSDAGHQKLALEMLHNIVVGPVGVENAYFAAFIKGFLLPCSTGIDLVDIVRSFFGGAEEFIRTAEASIICNFDSLHIRIVCSIRSGSLDELADALSIAGPPFAGRIFEDVIKDFLLGVGAPCPQMLAGIQDRFSPEVKASLSGLQSPTYRMRLMCWAVTGATRVLKGGEPMQIILVDDNDTSYLSESLNDGQCEAFLSSGSCAFRTCSRSMRIPVSYLIQQLKNTYNPDTELCNAQVAIHHWLLVQLLDSAGTYNMV
ncbi:hypothetical protein F5879DRAFT_991545 [Lentinula edodes]|nr:hypothetical protein F5879DRAFT_991545 [Lentinula edodes]